MNATDASLETAHEVPEGDSADNDMFVLGTNVSWTYLEERLTRALGTNAKFGCNRRIESIGVGQGFMSVMGRLYPEWIRQQDALPRSFIVKIPSAVVSHAYLKSMVNDKILDLYNERTAQELYDDHEHMIQQVHNTECGFYELSESLAEKLKVPKAFVIERFVEGYSKGILILEDLFDAYIVPTYNSITVDEATQVIDALSAVHAHSLCNDSWLRISKADLKDLFVAINESPERMMQVLELSADLDHERLDEKIKKLRGIFSDVFDLDFEGNLYKQMGLKPVMIHGDLWCSNVMWRGEEGSRYLAALIDWQLVHPGCPSQDLARFITCALSGEDRRKHSENLLERYLTKLEENLGHKAPFTLEQMDISLTMMGANSDNSVPEHVVVKDASCDMKTFMVLLMELFLSLIGAALCALTMVLLLRFNVFHVNQRILIANVALIVLFGSFYASLRAIIAVYQCESMPTPLSSSLGMDNERVAECYLRDSISPAIATAIAMSGLCIATERFYATLNFAVYEYQEMSYVVSTACVVTLLPIVFYVIGFLVSLCTGKVELTFSCAKPIDGDYIKENIVYIIAAFFDIIFLALYILLYFENKNRQVEYIRDHYDSFSSRFQINENIKSTRLLFPFNIAFLFLLTLTIFTTETFSDDRLLQSNRATKEMRNLIYPLFAIIFPLSYIYQCPIFYSKARTVAAEMFFPHSEEVKKSRRLSALLSEKQRAHFDVLIASWEEDAMKMQ